MVDTKSETKMRRHMISDPVAYVIVQTKGLVDIVGKLRLVEISGSAIAIPLRHVLQRVLDSQAIHGNIIAIDHKAMVTGVC